MDRASKKGKGQLPILIGALYKGKEAHVSLSAGGNDMAQLTIPLVGVVITSEKYTLVGPSVKFLLAQPIKMTNFQIISDYTSWSSLAASSQNRKPDSAFLGFPGQPIL